jgi:AcrR family transcriptional regulator/DNA-binding MarR family transcriptional regulator
MPPQRAKRPAPETTPPQRLAEIQRSRLMAGAVGAIDEFGYGRATVAQITARSRVSRRTFYELFENREECLAELIEEVVALVEGEIATAGLDGLAWRERVRGGLWAILSFFDREPALARVCVVQALRGGPQVLERREQILARLARVLDEGRDGGARAGDCAPLTAEGLVGAALTIVYARLLRREHEPLGDLLGELTSMIVLPYLGSAAARRERERPLPAASVQARGAVVPKQSDRDPLQEVPMRLTYRTARVLACIAEQPGINNRVVAERAGVADQGQISKLLARLERLGLAENRGVGHAKGEPNAWRLTVLGQQVAQRLNVNNRARQAVA